MTPPAGAVLGELVALQKGSPLRLLAWILPKPMAQPQGLCRIDECLEDLMEDCSESAHSQGVTLQLQISAANAVVRGHESELIRLVVWCAWRWSVSEQS